VSPKLQRGTFNVFAGATHPVVNSHRPISCVGDEERNRILLGILDYFLKTPIRFKLYDPLTDKDYIHITGEDSGCWSFVGRKSGVSSKEEGIVKTGQTLRSA
jgi:hypothetical protein